MQHQYLERKEKPPKIDFSSSAFCCLNKLFSCSPKNLWHVDWISVLFYWGTKKGLECHSRKITLDHLLLAWDFSPLPLHPLFSILFLPHLPLLLTLSLLQSLSLYFIYHKSLVSTRVFQFSSSLLLISQMYCISLHHFAVFSYSTFVVHCKPIYSPSNNADSIKQCPKSTKLSEYEWFIAE